VSYETLLASLTDGVACITLNRPEVRNALSRTMVAELEAALASFEADPAARVVVLAGAGDRAFCAGADLKGAGDRGTTLQARESFGGLARILEAMARMRTPVIAQVHGFALAGGCGLAVGCDIVIASEDATFGLPEITLGLLPLIVMAPVLRAAGTKRGLPFVLSAENISAREALDIGLVSRVVPRRARERNDRTGAARGRLESDGRRDRQGSRVDDPGHGVRQGLALPARADDAGLPVRRRA